MLKLNWFSSGVRVPGWLPLLVCLTPGLRAEPDFFPPIDGWDYIYTGDAAAATSEAALDGTWDHNNGSDEWDGTAPGAGAPGGLDIVAVEGEPGNHALLMVDAVTESGRDNNRRLALTHNLASGEGVAGDFLDDGATISFRVRLPSGAPDLGGGPNGLNPPAGQKGIFNIRQDAGRIGFALGVAGTDSAYPESGMLISNGEEAVFHSMNPTAWNECWITIRQNAENSSLYDLQLYLNGGSTPALSTSVALNPAAEESYPYLSMQLSSTSELAAVEVDFFAFKEGVHRPGSADDDSLPDAWELSFFSDLTQGDDDDPDGDGLTNIQEFNVGSNPTLIDTDGDELRDGDEFNIHNSDPLLGDTDGDGLDDGEEVNAQPATDPADADTDDDGLNDGREVGIHGTNPTFPDTDGDTFSDSHEIAAGSDPLDADNVPRFPTLDGVLINEFMASNNSTLLDEDDDASDWLELWNPTGNPVEIGGWYLTDDPVDPTRWRLPDGLVLEAGDFLVVFASGKDRAVIGSELHTDFRLDRQSGSHLALVAPDGIGGTKVVSVYALYPKQEEDVSYGAHGSTSPLSVGYFMNPTPDGANGRSGVAGFVKDTT
ncbi:MAG: lamin tail domain-containing protein, partial [Akkermansiaceae bacterium]|nr:lamin tail domain-containing protein [Akkermansiaceae bacterium]